MLHVFQIGVGRQYRGLGIAQTMIQHVHSHARKRGFEQIVADCNGPASKKAFEKCGFSITGFSSYEKFYMGGVFFLQDLKVDFPS